MQGEWLCEYNSRMPKVSLQRDGSIRMLFAFNHWTLELSRQGHEFAQSHLASISILSFWMCEV